ncbi:MAG TPA: alpha/beta fold hydrolase [Ktedonobacteraceae bacterium]|nr:alpha/beta fold hydrolase [Ktedonobacteraceae bacterium]
MAKWSRGVIASASSIGLVAVMVSSGIVLLAHRFVNEFTHSHVLLDDNQFTWDMPVAESEPSAMVRRQLRIDTCDGQRLCGEFWAQPRPAPTIILCHGYRVPQVHLRPVAALEYRAGYNVLLFDFRGHGKSTQAVVSGGIAEVRDLQAAVQAARQQPETLPGKLALHGFSMGAAVSLLMPLHPEVVGIIADSAYARLDAILQRLAHYRLTEESTSWPALFHKLQVLLPALCWAAVVTSRLLFRLRFGHPLIARPDRSFKHWVASAKITHQPYPAILLIHSRDDELIPFSHARQIAAQAQACHIPIETYFVHHAPHGGAYGSDPEQYVIRLKHFLAQQTGTPASEREVLQTGVHFRDDLLQV